MGSYINQTYQLKLRLIGGGILVKIAWLIKSFILYIQSNKVFMNNLKNHVF